MNKKKIIFTIGHSTHTIREFIKILEAYDIEMLIDVRHYPGSRYCPQFGKIRLKNSLAKKIIAYEHLLSLGGRRPPNKDVHINDGWRSPQFRGYADYMQTEEFKAGLDKLCAIASRMTSVIMCSEAVPWRCHRSMIADALLVRNFSVIDIFTERSAREHHMTPFAKIKRKEIVYPAY